MIRQHQRAAGRTGPGTTPDSRCERFHRGRGRRTGHAAVFRLGEVVELRDVEDSGGFPARFPTDVA
jgi:hypothetical protein